MTIISTYAPAGCPDNENKVFWELFDGNLNGHIELVSNGYACHGGNRHGDQNDDSN